MDGMLHGLREWLGDAYLELFDAIDRKALTPQERLRARLSDPAFARDDDQWQLLLQAMRERQRLAERYPPPRPAAGMIPGVNGALPPKRSVPGMLPWPSAAGVRG